MKEYGIFCDESEDYTDAESVEAGFYSEEAATLRLQEIREKNGDPDDNCFVHEVEEEEDDNNESE